MNTSAINSSDLLRINHKPCKRTVSLPPEFSIASFVHANQTTFINNFKLCLEGADKVVGGGRCAVHETLRRCRPVSPLTHSWRCASFISFRDSAAGIKHACPELLVYPFLTYLCTSSGPAAAAAAAAAAAILSGGGG